MTMYREDDLRTLRLSASQDSDFDFGRALENPVSNLISESDFLGPRSPRATRVASPASGPIQGFDYAQMTTVAPLDGSGGSGRLWAVGASGQEIALNASARRDIVYRVDPVNQFSCKICEWSAIRDKVAAGNPGGAPPGESLVVAMEPIVLSGSVDACLAFLRTVAPELAVAEFVAEHMNHGIKDAQLLDKHMVQRLIQQSYGMACGLGSEYAMRVTTECGQLCVPNRQNIAGFATATSCFIKLINLKKKLDK